MTTPVLPPGFVFATPTGSPAVALSGVRPNPRPLTREERLRARARARWERTLWFERALERLCPLRALWSGWGELTRPPLAWAVRWSAGGGDPLRTAWQHALDAEGLITLHTLQVSGLDRYAAHAWARAEAERMLGVAVDAYVDAMPDDAGLGMVAFAAAECAALRRRFGPPPPLAELLARRADE